MQNVQTQSEVSHVNVRLDSLEMAELALVSVPQNCNLEHHHTLRDESSMEINFCCEKGREVLGVNFRGLFISRYLRGMNFWR